MFQVALDDDFFNTVPLIEVNNQRDGLPFESINIVSGIGNFVLTLLFFLQIALAVRTDTCKAVSTSNVDPGYVDASRLSLL